MAKRKPLTKAIRFEVFKRDRFTCQYCGRKAPEVVLEVDHIVPVSKGGGNELMNLVTSCFDCNRGKGKKKLDDTSTVMKQRAELDRMAERQEQARMMMQWKHEMEETDTLLVDDLIDHWISITGFEPSESNRKVMWSYYNRFGYDEVYDAIYIAVEKYFIDGDPGSAITAYQKIGGICFNRRKQRESDAEQNY